MCTAVSFHGKDHYFGRNLDLEYSYREEVVVTPRNYPVRFRRMCEMAHHFALIGMAMIADGFPLYYEATNECGLSMAGLNFPGNAYYPPENADKVNVAPFELIPWLLGQCSTVEEVRALLRRVNPVRIDFSAALPLSPLHWMISDREESIVVEPMQDGLRIYDNPVDVMTNNPPFDYHLYHLQNYMHLTIGDPDGHFVPDRMARPYSRGMGAIGLPGDLSSASRFVRAVFTARNAVPGETETESVSQFFHILESVSQTLGCVQVGEKLEQTVYSCCCNTDRGIYYYTTYFNRQITAIDLHRTDLNGSLLRAYPLVKTQQIRMEE
jgi:choloylglycine hydrolase